MKFNGRPLGFHLWRLSYIKFSRVEHNLSHKIGEEVLFSRTTISARSEFCFALRHDLFPSHFALTNINIVPTINNRITMLITSTYSSCVYQPKSSLTEEQLQLWFGHSISGLDITNEHALAAFMVEVLLPLIYLVCLKKTLILSTTPSLLAPPTVVPEPCLVSA